MDTRPAIKKYKERCVHWSDKYHRSSSIPTALYQRRVTTDHQSILSKMHISSTNLAAFTFLLFSSSILNVFALPTLQERTEVLERVPASDPYPDAAGCQAAYIAGDQPSVFFSNTGSSSQEQRDWPDTFAAQINGRTFKTAYTAGFVDRRTGAGGKIFYGDFAKRFSTVFAEQATGTAYVLMRDDPNGPKANSVWVLYERPALESSGKVDKIVKVDPTNNFAQTVLWTKPASKVKVKRDDPDKRAYVLDWDAPADGPYWLAPDQ